jgi:hypothetical protein
LRGDADWAYNATPFTNGNIFTIDEYYGVGTEGDGGQTFQQVNSDHPELFFTLNTVAAGTNDLVATYTLDLVGSPSVGDQYVITATTPIFGNGVAVGGGAGSLGWQVSNDLTVNITGTCDTPPAIVSAESVKSHNGTEWGIDMMDPLSTESRDGGVTQIRVVFDIDVDLSAASAAVTAGSGSVSGFSQPATDEMLIDLAGATHPVPGNGFCLNVQLDGIACDNPGPAQPSGILNGAILKIEVFKGDADYDKFTGFNDYVEVKSVLGKNHTQPEFLPQCDVDVDGFIGFNDYVAVKSNLGKSTPDCP